VRDVCAHRRTGGVGVTRFDGVEDREVIVRRGIGPAFDRPKEAQWDILGGLVKEDSEPVRGRRLVDPAMYRAASWSLDPRPSTLELD
jgi:hypothetical protein